MKIFFAWIILLIACECYSKELTLLLVVEKDPVKKGVKYTIDSVKVRGDVLLALAKIKRQNNGIRAIVKIDEELDLKYLEGAKFLLLTAGIKKAAYFITSKKADTMRQVLLKENVVPEASSILSDSIWVTYE